MEARLGQVEPVHADESFEIGDLSDDERPEIAPCVGEMNRVLRSREQRRADGIIGWA
jgi:hypothetical protein